MTSPARRVALLLAALSPALVAVPATEAATPAAYRSCPSVKDVGPTGQDPADAVSVRAKVTSCKTARVVIRRWVPATVKGGDDVRVGRYRCVQSMTGYRIAVRCTASGDRVVRFKLG